MQNTTGHQSESQKLDKDQSTNIQHQTDTQSTAPPSREGNGQTDTQPTFRDALDALGLLSAQCGNATIRKRQKDRIYQYLLWAGLWMCHYGIEDDYPTKQEAKKLLEGLKDS